MVGVAVKLDRRLCSNRKLTWNIRTVMCSLAIFKTYRVSTVKYIRRCATIDTLATRSSILLQCEEDNFGGLALDEPLDLSCSRYIVIAF